MNCSTLLANRSAGNCRVPRSWKATCARRVSAWEWRSVPGWARGLCRPSLRGLRRLSADAGRRTVGNQCQRHLSLAGTVPLLGVTEVHHVSTAFVCGDRRGTVYEDELDHRRRQRQRLRTEQVRRRAVDPRFSRHARRPSIARRSSSATAVPATPALTTIFIAFSNWPCVCRVLRDRHEPSRVGLTLRLRLPLTGEEVQNIVPVDWVSQALTRTNAAAAPAWPNLSSRRPPFAAAARNHRHRGGSVAL